MNARTRKYLIIGCEVVLLLLLLSIIFVVETQHLSEADKNSAAQGLPSFNPDGNVTNITVEDIDTDYGSYTIRTYHFTDGTAEERLYSNTGNESVNVANIFVDKNDIVLGVI